jgi:hypothetical protein
MKNRDSCSSVLRCGSVVLMVLAAAAAQQQPIPGFGAQPIPGFGAQPQQPLFQRSFSDQLQSTWVQPRPQLPFTGFPVFPSRLSDYSKGPGGGLLQALVQGQGLPGLSIPGLGGQAGMLPGFGLFPGQQQGGLGRMPPMGQLQPSDGDPLPLPEAEPEVGWPNWANTRDREPLPFAEHLALLVRHGDRVWWKLPEEEAMVPLYFHDKFRTLTQGSAVEVRQAGEFELLMHRSTRIVARGRTTITIEEMNPEKVRFVVQSLTRLAITAGGREHQIELPGGSRLLLSPQDVTDDATMAVLLERAIEPAWLGGRASLFNVGSSDVRWQFGVQSITIPPGHRVVFFLTPPATPYAEQLLTEGARAAIEDGIMVVRAVNEVGVSWSGARFQLPAGSELRLDPLQGQPFTKALPARAAQ